MKVKHFFCAAAVSLLLAAMTGCGTSVGNILDQVENKELGTANVYEDGVISFSYFDGSYIPIEDEPEVDSNIISLLKPDKDMDEPSYSYGSIEYYLDPFSDIPSCLEQVEQSLLGEKETFASKESYGEQSEQSEGHQYEWTSGDITLYATVYAANVERGSFLACFVSADKDTAYKRAASIIESVELVGRDYATEKAKASLEVANSLYESKISLPSSTDEEAGGESDPIVMKSGDRLTLNIQDAEDLSFQSEDESVAKVEDGTNIIAIGQGETNIVFSTEYGAAGKIHVTVEP